MRTSLRTIPPPDTFSRQTTSVITLGQVRSGPRITNEYVDSPCVKPLPAIKNQLATVVRAGKSPGFAHRVIHNSRVGEEHNGSQRPALTSLSSPIVNQQPLPKLPPLKNEHVESVDGNLYGGQSAGNHAIVCVGGSHGDSIICEKCGKCRCTSCTEVRPLPSRWCCRGACELSLDKALDVCTCFCCIECMFYHCGPEEDNEFYENPCACCSHPHCCQRWTVMGLTSLVLPCLWAYWPIKSCLAGCTWCYNHCRHKGCQCHTDRHDKQTPKPGIGDSDQNGCSGRVAPSTGRSSKHSISRRLLIESDSSGT